MRPWSLLALLLAAPVGAQDLGDAGGIDLGAARRISGKAPAAPAYDAGNVRARQAAVASAGLPLDFLIETGQDKPGWSVANVHDFRLVPDAASRATCRVQANANASGDAYKGLPFAGSLANADGTLRGDMSRGCIAHQQATFTAVKPLLERSSLEVKKIRYGLVPQHNAVIVFPRGSDWRYTGVVLDGWKRQECRPERMIYLYKDWGGIRPVRFGGTEIEVNPNPATAMPRLLADDE